MVFVRRAGGSRAGRVLGQIHGVTVDGSWCVSYDGAEISYTTLATTSPDGREGVNVMHWSVIDEMPNRLSQLNKQRWRINDSEDQTGVDIGHYGFGWILPSWVLGALT